MRNIRFVQQEEQKEFAAVNKLTRSIVKAGQGMDKAAKFVQKLPKMGRVAAKTGYYRTGRATDNVVKFVAKNPVAATSSVLPVPLTTELGLVAEAGLKKVPAYARATNAMGNAYSGSIMSRKLREMPSIHSQVSRFQRAFV